jgi:PQQ-like domain
MMRLALVVLAGGVVLSACTSGPASPQRSVSPSVSAVAGPSVAATSTVPPLRLGDAPLWTRMVRRYYGATPPPAPVAELDDIRLVGDALLTIGSVPEHRGTHRLVVSDAKTGAVRWSVTRGDRVGGGGSTYGFLLSARVVGDPAGDWTIVTTFERKLGGTTVEEGIIGLSGTDGSLRWRIPVQRARRCSCPWTRMDVMLLGPASPTTVAVEILTDTTEGQQATRTVAYDVATRLQVWTAPGVHPAAIEGDLLVAERPKLPANITDTPPTTLSALDLRTGAVKWDLTGRYPQSGLTYAAGDTLVVNLGDATAFVDTASGRELGTSQAKLTSCGRTPTVFACRDTAAEVGGDKAVTVQRSGDTAAMAVVPGSQWCWRVQVWQELLYCDDTTDQPYRSGAIDQTGKVATPRLPGRLEAVNDRFAVFSTGSFTHDQGAFAVYSVS